MDSETSTQCLACNTAAIKYFGERNGYRYFRCSNCHTLQLEPMPTKSQLAELYDKEYATAGHCQDTPESRNKHAVPQFNAISTVLLQYCQPELVLDYGPGWAGLLNNLKSRSINVEGCELSAEMAAYCSSQGYVIHHCELADIQGSNRYDAILLSSVFEHLVAHEEWLANAKRLLKENGLLISLQPTAPFATLLGTLTRFGIKRLHLPQLHQVFWPPWHTVLFSLKGMQSLLEKNGFELQEVKPAPLQQEGGLTGILQFFVSLTNKIAVPIFGVKWPLCVGHIFVFRVRE